MENQSVILPANGGSLIQKVEMKKRGVRSSDTSDALCLTFALPASALQDSNTNSKTAATIMQGQKIALKARSNLHGSQQNI